MFSQIAKLQKLASLFEQFSSRASVSFIFGPLSKSSVTQNNVMLRTGRMSWLNNNSFGVNLFPFKTNVEKRVTTMKFDFTL